jgi:hypothetical protein
MQVAASETAELIVCPRKMVAPAIPVVTIARIRAYSAADAPLSSWKKLIRLFIIHFLVNFAKVSGKPQCEKICREF